MLKLYIIGIGYRPFASAIRDIIAASDVILASERLFDIFRQYDEYEAVKEKVNVINNVDETFNFIKSQIPTLKSHIVLLASGDPLFFGIGRRALREFGKESVEIIPDLSCIQLAFSKIKEPWEDAFLMSLHGGPNPDKRRYMPYDIADISQLLKIHKKIAVLTDKINNPSKIAQVINSSVSLKSLKIFVCEKLGYPDEKITEGTPEEIENMAFIQPNLVILLNQLTTNTDAVQTPLSCCSNKGGFLNNPVFGLSEEDIIHTNGLITKDEIRAVSLHKLRLLPKGVFWDIGAGSGSVSLEASRLCPETRVYAVEKDPVQIANIKENKRKFNSDNIEVIEGQAPEILNDLPNPQRVFIGGSGGRLEEIIKFVAATNTEIVVVNAVTIETLNKAVVCLLESGYNLEAVQLGVSKLKRIGEGNYLSAFNPVFIIRGIRS
jgi:precorrin-6Y C5,15-methyltransferase (decarboxylating)